MSYSPLIAKFLEDAKRLEPTGGPMTNRVNARIKIEEEFYNTVIARREAGFIPTEIEERLTLILIGVIDKDFYVSDSGEIISGITKSFLDSALIPDLKAFVKGVKGEARYKALGFKLLKARVNNRKVKRNIVSI